MAATYITQSELRVLLGIGSLYENSVVEEVCQAAENIIKGHLWFNNYYAAARSLTDNVATLYFQQPHGMYVGQSVVITNAGSPFNGTKTITEINGATQVSALNYQNYSLNSSIGSPKATNIKATISKKNTILMAIATGIQRGEVTHHQLQSMLLVSFRIVKIVKIKNGKLIPTLPLLLMDLIFFS